MKRSNGPIWDQCKQDGSCDMFLYMCEHFPDTDPVFDGP